MTLTVTRISDGFWYWRTTHPDCGPDGWPNGTDAAVGSAFVEDERGITLIDPQVPIDEVNRDRFWKALDRDLARHPDGSLAILLTCPWHERSASDLVERYRDRTRVTVWAPIGSALYADVHVTDPFLDDKTLPGGVIPYTLEYPGGKDNDETIYVIPSHGAVVFGDSVIGRNAGVEAHGLAAPSVESIVGDSGIPHEVIHEWQRTTLRPTLERILAIHAPTIAIPTHGEPVLADASASLATLIASLPTG
ncbi:MAG: hypothetical protein NTV35_08120 [Chloroflexi bacterium]|nr:hypothetical protein [Chloroflexota bacterium]